MRFKKVKKILKKINNLHQSILDEDESISNIEKQLFLSYIKNLYEAVADGDDEDGLIPIVSGIKPQVEREIQKEIPEKVEKIDRVTAADVMEKSILDELAEQEIETIDAESLINAEVTEEPMGEQEELVTEVQESIETVIAPLNDEKEEALPQGDEVEEVQEVESAIDSYVESKELSQLFEAIEVKELSAKLANSPIKSIKSKLGINEKLLTVKELFSKNQSMFNEVVEHLDKLDSYEDAKKYLVKHVVNEFDWLSDKKIKKATRFVQLIQRRYL